MSDLVERLRNYPYEACKLAADRIAELEAENKRLERREFGVTTSEAIAALDACEQHNSILQVSNKELMADGGQMQATIERVRGLPEWTEKGTLILYSVEDIQEALGDKV